MLSYRSHAVQLNSMNSSREYKWLIWSRIFSARIIHNELIEELLTSVLVRVYAMGLSATGLIAPALE
jgi:hypothetical protein